MSARGAASLVQKPPRDPDATLASWFISGHECIVSSPQPSISAQTPLVSVEETIVQSQAQFGEDTPILCPAQKTSRLVSSKSLCPWAVRVKARVSWGWKLHQAGPLSPVSAERPRSSPATAGAGHFLSGRSAGEGVPSNRPSSQRVRSRGFRLDAAFSGPWVFLPKWNFSLPSGEMGGGFLPGDAACQSNEVGS